MKKQSLSLNQKSNSLKKSRLKEASRQSQQSKLISKEPTNPKVQIRIRRNSIGKSPLQQNKKKAILQDNKQNNSKKVMLKLVIPSKNPLKLNNGASEKQYLKLNNRISEEKKKYQQKQPCSDSLDQLNSLELQQKTKAKELREKLKNRLYYQQKFIFNYLAKMELSLINQKSSSIFQKFLNILEINGVIHEEEKQRIFMNKNDLIAILQLIVDLIVAKNDQQITYVLNDYEYLRQFVQIFTKKYSQVSMDIKIQKCQYYHEQINLKIQPIEGIKQEIVYMSKKIEELQLQQNSLIKQIQVQKQKLSQIQLLKVNLTNETDKLQQILLRFQQQALSWQNKINQYNPQLINMKLQFQKINQEVNQIYNYPITQQKRKLFKGVAQDYIQAEKKLRSHINFMKMNMATSDPNYDDHTYPFKQIDESLQIQFDEAKTIILQERALQEKQKKAIIQFVNRAFRVYNLQYQQYKQIFQFKTKCTKQLLEKMTIWGLIDLTKQGCLLEGRKSFAVEYKSCLEMMANLTAICQEDTQNQKIKNMNEYLSKLNNAMLNTFLIYKESNMFF